MTPRQLKYFVEIARTGSITTAASTLHIAQPALSHHIAAMEEELGVSLLERHARGVRPTASACWSAPRPSCARWNGCATTCAMPPPSRAAT
jgi:DNA-binding transcriptional LysR family regulator